MDRRTIAQNIFGILLGGGIAAMIGSTALPTGSPYFDVLILGGIVAIVVGVGGLLWLLIWQPKRRAPEQPQELHTGSTIGIRIVNSEGFSVGGVETHGFDRGVVLDQSPNVKFDSLLATGPTSKAPSKPKKPTAE